MAARKSINLLPGVFQTDANKKFLSATVDQLIAEPKLKNLYGYIGRKFSPTFKKNDSYIIESSSDRQDYQLEPSTIVRDNQNNVTFFSSYIDFLNKIDFHGGIVDDQSRLFSSEYYSFDPVISYDKFVNFGQYYWLPNGPGTVNVNSSGVELVKTYQVRRNDNTLEYDYLGSNPEVFVSAGSLNIGETYTIETVGNTNWVSVGATANQVGETFIATGVGTGTGIASIYVKNNTVILARGGTYTFNLNQDSSFWIQTEPGIDGLVNATPTISSREVLGVENNGAKTGSVVFRVPQNYAQDRFVNMPLVANVDYAAPIPYSELHNSLVSVFVSKYPQYAGIIGQLNNKTLIFVDQQNLVDVGEEIWTAKGVYDKDGYEVLALDEGTIVPEADRYSVWKVYLIESGTPGDPIVRLEKFLTVNVNEKVFVKYGLANANKEFYKDTDSFFKRVPVLSSLLDTLYVQDGTDPRIVTTIKIVDFDNFNIDVENDILDKQFYTSPNGIVFTSGLKIKFGNDVVPDQYKNGTYYVENVGDSIRLVDVNLLITPETYNDELAINYPLNTVTLVQPTVELITPGTVITIGSTSITIDTEIAAGSTKLTTLDSITNILKGDAVTGTGIAEGTLVFDAYPDSIFPDYISIKRDALDLNAWSRSNRWFHLDVIRLTAEYNNETLILDQKLRAQRPIVQFEGDLQLFNNGRIGKRAIDILDTSITDAFSNLEGQPLSSDNTISSLPGTQGINGIAFGVPLFDGMRVIFGADTDPLVQNKTFVLNLVQYQVDTSGNPIGPYYIKLNLAVDSEPQINDTVVVKLGRYKGSGWWYDGTQWLESQQKTGVNQEPLYDVYEYNPLTDTIGVSLSNTTKYPRSTFVGTKIFGYERNTNGTNDAILGFPLKYRSFTSQGDIQFGNYFNTDTFTYVDDQTFITKNINTGFLQTIVDRNTTKNRNTWKTVVDQSKQYQIIEKIYDGNSKVFKLDIVPAPVEILSASVPHLKVYVNELFLSFDNWTFDQTTKELTINSDLAAGDIVNILIFSQEVSEKGHFLVPTNLDLNAQNLDIDSVTLGQIRNHLIELSRNTTVLDGAILGPNNLRDLEIKAQGGTILQHSSPIPFAELFLIEPQANFVESLRFAQKEYTKFKNKFLELAVSTPGIDPNDAAASVDLIITKINVNKNPTFPFFYSDMVPYGTLKNVIEYIVFDPLINSYEITNIFASNELSNKAVLVYLNSEQLILGWDYSFDTARPAITLNLNNVTLNVEDVIRIVEYQNTDGCYIPETPTKLGLYPKFVPEIYSDNTYRTEINVIRGHDGSITPAFDDYRDDLLLELEKRIFNNIKVTDTVTTDDIYRTIPGKFRNTEYSFNEMWQILSRSFLSWVGNNKIDFSENNTFLSNDGFTWNYANFVDRVDGEYLPGSWRNVYKYFYDTTSPHTRAWEMLGFDIKPEWWEDFYGPAPYTGGNKLLWDDLEAGRIRQGPRSTVDFGFGPGIDPYYRRPGLSQVIPVDQNGYLLSPAQAIARATNPKAAARSWEIGQLGPVEYAWYTSSDFPFAMQQALALMKPARYFGQLIDTYRIYYNRELKQYLTLDNHHVRQTDIKINGDTTNNSVERTAGYINYIADYLRNMGIDPVTKINSMLKNYEVNLAYKLAGFSDKKYLQILAEQSSPTGTSASVLLPDENYDVVLYKSTPIEKIVYSAVIVEKTSNGYTVRGYDLNNPYFTIIPSIVSTNADKITVLNESGVVYNDYQRAKLSVPYGYEFSSNQQVVDFLISYERYLIAQGFTFGEFDELLAQSRDWKLSVREFLFWIQQGWTPGSIIVLSPTLNSLNALTSGSIVDGIEDSQYGSRIVDQNFNIVKASEYNILRTPSEFNITLANESSVIAFAELNLVQYEHILRFDNVTVFNDIVYKPELGNRQYRLKLIGQKTDNWDGSLSAPGFIYNSAEVQTWAPGVDYLKGDLVIYKNQYYVALEKAPAAVDFDFKNWKLLSLGEIQTGLLNNFSTIAVGSQSYYDSYGKIKDNNQIQYSHGLIGFKPRQYLSDLGLNDTTQIELYKGYIKQKGSTNAVTALTKAEFNNVSSDISFFEEWAIRTGEYGALNSNPFIEIALDEKEYSVNPALAEFVNRLENDRGNGLNVFNQFQLYKSSNGFDGNIALNRDQYSNYDLDILTAGYVNIDDVDATLYNITDYAGLNGDVTNIGSGYTIWVAKDFTNNWNVYRVSETNNHVTQVSNALDGLITFTTETEHLFKSGDIFLVRGFDLAFDGFYQVSRVIDINNVIVQYFGDPVVLETLSVQTGFGILLKLDSLRFQYMEDARVFGYNGNPKHGWQTGEKIWINDDAATTAVQGQPFETANGGWRVYEKTHPWSYDHSVIKTGDNQLVSNDKFGESVKLSYDGLVATIGAPNAYTLPYYNEISGNLELTGQVYVFNKNFNNIFVEGEILIPNAGNASVVTKEFGQAVDQAIDRVLVGAPGSYGNIGFVYTYYRAPGTTKYDIPQVVWAGYNVSGNIAAVANIAALANDRFGSSVSFDEHGRWMYVGAPGNDKVYIYGLNRNVSSQTELRAINDKNTFFFGNIANSLSITTTVVANDIISQPSTGATAFVVNSAVATSNIDVTTRTLFAAGPAYGNLYINGVDSGLYLDTIANVSVTSGIYLTSFTPEVANVASSLRISVSKQILIPDLDYTLVANVVTFKSNIAEGLYVIEQGPYYHYVTSVEGPAGSKFGHAIDSSLDGAQLGVGAPDANVWVDGEWIRGAGAVYVYDRVIEAFNTTGNLTYTTQGNIDIVRRVTINDIEVNNYKVTGTNTIEFQEPPEIGQLVFIETNQFNLLEKLIGIDSLEGGLAAIQANAAFGTDLTICSNNCAIYVGAPYYNNYPQYSTGAVWKFHNRGRLYGTNTAFKKNPIFLPGDAIRLDNFLITVSGRVMPTTHNGVQANILTLSSNVVAATGEIITQTTTGANVRVLEDTGPEGSSTLIVEFNPLVVKDIYGNAVTSVATAFYANAQPIAPFVSGQTVQISGANISDFNGLFTVTSANVNCVQFTNGTGGFTNNTGITATNVSSDQFGYGPGNVIYINGSVTSAYPMASLDSLVKDVNDANLLGISAVNENGYLRLDSNKTIAKNLLRILTGFNVSNPTEASNVFSSAELAIFAFMQIIVNPYNASNEYFGNKVVLAQNTYMLVISSERGTTRADTTFDNNTTTIDDTSTVFFDSIKGSGSTYVYELYDDPRDEVENPGRYQFAQQLNMPDLFGDNENDQLNPGDRFGAAIDIIGTTIIVSAPADDTNVTDGGSVYIFSNPNMTRGWNLIRYQQPKVDIETVNRMFLYSNLTNTILTNLEFIDPVKGKILGAADQDITYKTQYDPAVYNSGTRTDVRISGDIYWGANQVDQVWWNLDQVRFIDYEQGSLTYRSINWGRLFPGSIVEVCEWVESRVPPSQYVSAGYDGTPKYPDDSAYVEIAYVDPTTNIVGSLFYFWVVNKTSVNPNNETRTLPIASIADYIANPKGQGISYAAVIKSNAVILYNVGNYLSASNTILHVDYELLKNNNIIHSEYELIQRANPLSVIPENLSNKLIDSLSGLDIRGDIVPDPKLSVADRYGISIRPRQSMFVDRLRAMSDLVLYVNSVLIKKPITRQYSLDTLMSEEPKPNFKLGEYDQSVSTQEVLPYINTKPLPIGYKVLVENNTEQDNLWTLYELDAQKNWIPIKIQSYKTSLYWRYVDWYEEGFGPESKLDFVVETLVDARKLAVSPGQEILVRVNTGSTFAGWIIYSVTESGEFKVVGIQNGTIQLNESLGNFKDNGIGLGNQGFDSNRFDQSPTQETRYVVQALKDDIFIGELTGEYNKLFFVMMNYMLSEQKYVDWIFKTSFVSVAHYLRDLAQPANYIKDNVTYYEDYINEVKPYVTKVREYLTNYNKLDTYLGSVTDFDLAPYYDLDTNMFRSPSGEQVEKDEQLWATGYLTSTGQLINPDYKNWYNNRTYYVSRINVTNSGSGYTQPPVVTVTGGGSGSIPATATALIDYDPYGTIQVIDGSNVANVISTGFYPLAITSNILSVNGNIIVSTGDYVYQPVSNANAVITGTTYTTGFITLSNDTITGNVGDYITQANTSANVQLLNSVVDAEVIFVSFVSNGFTLGSNVLSVNGSVTSAVPLETAEVTNIPITYVSSEEFELGKPAGRISSILVTSPGSGYITTPVVTINGGFTTQARAYPILENKTSRSFDTTLKFDRISYGTRIKQWAANTSYAVSYGEIFSHSGVGYQLDVVNLYLSGNITVNKGDVITQTISGANVTVYAAATSSSIISVTYNNENNFVKGSATGNIQVNAGGNLSVNVANVVYTSTSVFDRPKFSIYSPANFDNANDRIMAYYAPADNMPAKDLNQLVPGIEYPGVQVQGTPFNWNPYFGTVLDLSGFDSVEYDVNGNPLLSTSILDSVIRSTFADETLGTRPEDINVDGGKFVDEYASHAPEELVPGIAFDTLDLKVYTSNVLIFGGNTVGTVGYRIFHNMVGNVSFLRVADAFTTTLSRDLYDTDTIIHVNDATRLAPADRINNIPGVIFIRGERITYWRNYAQEVTPWLANTVFAADSVISYSGNNYLTTSQINSATFDEIAQFTVTLSGSITANVGDYITQNGSTVNAQVVSANVLGSSMQVRYLTNATNFTFGQGNISINGTLVRPANVVTRVTSGMGSEISVQSLAGLYVGMAANVGFASNATIVAIYTSNSNVVMSSANTSSLNDTVVDFGDIGSANVSSTGIGIYPTEQTGNIRYIDDLHVLTQIRRGTEGTGAPSFYIWGTSVSDGSRRQEVPNSGFSNITLANTTTYGNAYVRTISANTVLTTSNIWQNPGLHPPAADGLGFAGGVTEQILFLRGFGAGDSANLALLPSGTLVSEDELHALLTENGSVIISE